MKNFKNLHLQFSAFLVFFISLYYGCFSKNACPALFDFKPETVDSKSIFTALMFLYLGMVFLWILGARKPNLWQTATITNITFMLSLALGRLTGICIYGWPSNSLIAGLFLELFLAVWGIWNLKKYPTIEKTAENYPEN